MSHHDLHRYSNISYTKYKQWRAYMYLHVGKVYNSNVDAQGLEGAGEVEGVTWS